jgi:DNA-directed RNA polymerase specialized sigma subunit
MNQHSHSVAWPPERVAARFQDAVKTESALPPCRMQGYSNIWPAIIRQSWETQDTDAQRPTRYPPTGKAVEEMVETHEWIQVLEETDRHIVWGYAQGVPRKVIANKLGIGRTTLHRRHTKALQKIADHLNFQRTTA